MLGPSVISGMITRLGSSKAKDIYAALKQMRCGKPPSTRRHRLPLPSHAFVQFPK